MVIPVEEGPDRAARTRLSLLREAEASAERIVGIVRMLSAALLGVVFFLAVSGAGPETGAAIDQVIARQHGVAVATMAASLLLGALSVVVARPALFRPWIPWASSAFDLTFVLSGLWISLVSSGLGANYLLAMPSAWLIPIVLAFGALRYNFRLQIAVTVAMALGLVAVSAMAGGWQVIPTGDPANANVMFALPPGIVRWAMILACGLVIAVAVLRTHRLLDRAMEEARRRMALTRYLPAELGESLAAGEEGGLAARRRQEIAILFTDIRGFTARAEDMSTEGLRVFVTAWRQHIHRAAREHGGIVDKHMGDAAMLLFGVAPAGHPDRAARNALACCQAILDVVTEWNAALAAEGQKPVAIGIGIHLGEVYCGTVGNSERLEFTVLGDAVNVAARLEGMTKALGVAALASDAVVSRAGPAARGWRSLGVQAIAGRSSGLPIHALEWAGPPSRTAPGESR